MEPTASSVPLPRAPLDALLALAGRARRLPANAVDRLLHPRRRRAALARVHQRRPAEVLFVCAGNIYRSPFAAALLERLLPEAARSAVRVSSAGFVGPGRPPPEPALLAAARRGVDLSAHRSSLLTPERVRGAGLVLVMEPRQAAAILARSRVEGGRVLVLGDFDPLPIDTRAVRDPWSAEHEVLERTYDRLERCVGALAAELGKVLEPRG